MKSPTLNVLATQPREVATLLEITQRDIIRLNDVLDKCQINVNLTDPQDKELHEFFIGFCKELQAIETGLEETYGKPDDK